MSRKNRSHRAAAGLEIDSKLWGIAPQGIDASGQFTGLYPAELHDYGSCRRKLLAFRNRLRSTFIEPPAHRSSLYADRFQMFVRPEAVCPFHISRQPDAVPELQRADFGTRDRMLPHSRGRRKNPILPAALVRILPRLGVAWKVRF
jgi:hypothetical protein